MIKVVVFKKDNYYIGFELNGHAKFDKYGKDIVCASVSILSQNCVNAITDILKAEVDFEQKNEGYFKIKVKDSDEIILDKANLLISSMLHGLNWIADNYRDYVSITSREVK